MVELWLTERDEMRGRGGAQMGTLEGLGCWEIDNLGAVVIDWSRSRCPSFQDARRNFLQQLKE